MSSMRFKKGEVMSKSPVEGAWKFISAKHVFYMEIL